MTLLVSFASGTGTGLSIVKLIAFGAGGFVALSIIVTIVCFVKKKKRQASKSFHPKTLFQIDYDMS